MAEVHQIQFRLPRWGSLRRSPRPLVGWGGDTPFPDSSPLMPTEPRSLVRVPWLLSPQFKHCCCQSSCCRTLAGEVVFQTHCAKCDYDICRPTICYVICTRKSSV